MIDSNPQDNRDSIAKETAQLGLDLPVLEDRAQLVATALGIGQTCDVICVNPTNWMTFYRGAIDRQSSDQKTKVRNQFRRTHSPEFKAMFENVEKWQEENSGIDKAIPTTMVAGPWGLGTMTAGEDSISTVSAPGPQLRTGSGSTH